MIIRKAGLMLSGALVLISAFGLTSAAQAAPGKSPPSTDNPGTNAVEAYNIYNVTTGKCADVPGFGAGKVGGPVNEYTCDGTAYDNQLWYFNYAGNNGSGNAVYLIQNAKDGLCLDVPFYGAVSAGTKVSEFHCAGPEDNQFFSLIPRWGPGGYYGSWLVNDKSGLCLDVDGVRTGGNDARLTLWYCSDSDDHIWQLV